jgi:hypothetical protein
MMGYFAPGRAILAIQRTSKIAARLAETETQSPPTDQPWQ